MTTREKVQAVLDSIVALKADSGFAVGLIADADKLKADCEAWLAIPASTPVPPPITQKAPGIYFTRNGLERNVELVFPINEVDNRIESSKWGGLLKETETVNINFVAPDHACIFELGYVHSGGAIGSTRQRIFTVWANGVQKFHDEASDGSPIRFGVNTPGRQVNLAPKDKVKYQMITKVEGLAEADVFIRIVDPQ